MYCTKKILDDLFWVGADDRRLVCFEGVYGVPDGVSYNSYVLLDDKTALFDAVDKAVSRTFLKTSPTRWVGGSSITYLFTIWSPITRRPSKTWYCAIRRRSLSATTRSKPFSPSF